MKMTKVFLFLAALLVALGSSPTPTHAQSRVPGTPTGVTAARTPADLTEVRVSWNLVSGATGYKVYWSESPSGSGTLEGSPTGRSFTSTNNATTRTHYFRVSAVNASGEGTPSSWVEVGPVSGTSGSTGRLPGSPTGVTAVRTESLTDVRVSWNAVSGATRYRVYCDLINQVDGNDSFLEGEPTTTSFTCNMIDPDRTYYFRVSAVNSAGEGAPSSWVEVGPVIRNPPSAPRGVTAARAYALPTAVELRWNEVGDVWWYRVYYSANGRDAVLESDYVSTPEYGSGNKRTDGTHYFRVTAVNGNGESAPSAWVSVGPFNGRPPAAPTGVTATRNPARPTEIRVSWNAVSGADSYKIDWTFTPGEVFSDGTSSTTTFTSTDKSTDETLYFWVLAVNAAGESERSARVTVGPVTR